MKHNIPYMLPYRVGELHLILTGHTDPVKKVALEHVERILKQNPENEYDLKDFKYFDSLEELHAAIAKNREDHPEQPALDTLVDTPNRLLTNPETVPGSVAQANHSAGVTV